MVKSLKEQLNDLSRIDKVFKSIFPIEDGNDKSTLEYISYKLDKPKFDVMSANKEVYLIQQHRQTLD